VRQEKRRRIIRPLKTGREPAGSRRRASCEKLGVPVATGDGFERGPIASDEQGRVQRAHLEYVNYQIIDVAYDKRILFGSLHPGSCNNRHRLVAPLPPRAPNCACSDT
jgi:hypothetical protein